MNVAIIDFNLGNVASVQKALDHLKIPSYITNDHAKIKAADFLILPGVGSFQNGMKNIQSLHLTDILHEMVLIKKKPVMGICLGMQLMASRGREGSDAAGLSWINGEVIPVPVKEKRIPHMGWNNITVINDTYFKNLPSCDFYFVHSYFFDATDPSLISSTVEYGTPLTASIQKENIFGTQFHPEKSQKAGLQVLNNFFQEYA